MANPSILFSSNPDYFLNDIFQKMMLRWNIYLQAENEDEDLLTEWEEVLLKDFRRYANEWLKENKRKTSWRKDLR